MSWHFSQALVEEYSVGTSLAGAPSSQLNVTPTQHKFWRNDKTMDASDLSRFGLTLQLLTAARGAELWLSGTTCVKELIMQHKKTEIRVEKRTQPTPRRVLVDHRLCGGAGCTKCRQQGTALVTVTIPPVGPIPCNEAAFVTAREHCPCYEGYPINTGVSQCTHASHRDDGEWCEFSACPRVSPEGVPHEPSSRQ